MNRPDTGAAGVNTMLLAGSLNTYLETTNYLLNYDSIHEPISNVFFVTPISFIVMSFGCTIARVLKKTKHISFFSKQEDILK